MGRTAESLHPDLSALSEHYSAAGEVNGNHSQKKAPHILFIDPNQSLANHCRALSQAVNIGNSHIIVFFPNFYGQLLGKALSERVLKSGFTSTEFNRRQVREAGYGQFEGAFSFRDVCVSA